MALSASYSSAFLSTTHSSSSSSSSCSSLKLVHYHPSFTNSHFPTKPTSTIPAHTLSITKTSSTASGKWRAKVSFFPAFLKKGKDAKTLKEELLEAIEPLDRGAEATSDDQQRIDQIARELEAVNRIKEPLKSDLLNGKWELIYTTSRSILQTQQLIIVIEAQTFEVKNKLPSNQCGYPQGTKYGILAIFQSGLIPVKAPGRARGELEITYLDEEFRVSRGDLGNLFILKMIDPSYRVPT